MKKVISYCGKFVNILIFDFDVEISMVETLAKQLHNSRVYINGDDETISILFDIE